MRQTEQRFISQNRSYIPLKPTGAVLHETANAGATAENHYKYFNDKYRGASAHAFVDWVKTIQLIPWEERAWHVGPTANKKFIGIEMCRPAKKNPGQFKIVYDETVQLFARLFFYVLKIDKVTPDNLLSHDDCRVKFKDTTHTDPLLYLKEYGKTMAGFRLDVQTALDKLKGSK